MSRLAPWTSPLRGDHRWRAGQQWSSKRLARYERWRRTDAAISAAAFDALNQLFSNDWVLLRALRSAGLGVVERLPALKQFFVAEAAGLTGEVPKLLRGERV